MRHLPDSKVYGANMGSIWIMSAPDKPHVGLMNLAIRVGLNELRLTTPFLHGYHYKLSHSNITQEETFHVNAHLVEEPHSHISLTYTLPSRSSAVARGAILGACSNRPSELYPQPYSFPLVVSTTVWERPHVICYRHKRWKTYFISPCIKKSMSMQTKY